MISVIVKLKMDKIAKQNERIAKLTFASIYPLCLSRIKLNLFCYN